MEIPAIKLKTVAEGLLRPSATPIRVNWAVCPQCGGIKPYPQSNPIKPRKISLEEKNSYSSFFPPLSGAFFICCPYCCREYR